jgi:hypothetical protein
MGMVMIRGMPHNGGGNCGEFGLQCWEECLFERFKVADIGIMSA